MLAFVVSLALLGQCPGGQCPTPVAVRRPVVTVAPPVVFPYAPGPAVPAWHWTTRGWVFGRKVGAWVYPTPAA